MAKNLKAVAVINDFAGIVTAMDADDLRQGAGQAQTNLACLKTGELRVRGGYKKVSFED